MAAGFIAAIDQLAFLAIGIDGVLDRELSVGVLVAFMTLRGRLASALAGLADAARRGLVDEGPVPLVHHDVDAVLLTPEHEVRVSVSIEVSRSRPSVSGLRILHPGARRHVGEQELGLLAFRAPGGCVPPGRVGGFGLGRQLGARTAQEPEEPLGRAKGPSDQRTMEKWGLGDNN